LYSDADSNELKNREKIKEMTCFEEWIFSLEGCGFSRDGIRGYQFDKRLEFFAPCYAQSLLLAEFTENHTLLYLTAEIYENHAHSAFQNPYKKIHETQKLKFFHE
jgi:hypothetical protein